MAQIRVLINGEIRTICLSAETTVENNDDGSISIIAMSGTTLGTYTRVNDDWFSAHCSAR